MSLNPLKRVNSILTSLEDEDVLVKNGWSQSPQAGQFNSYGFVIFLDFVAFISLNPLKRVNSILTAAFSSDCGAKCCKVKKDSDGKRWVEGVGGIFFDLI